MLDLHPCIWISHLSVNIHFAHVRTLLCQYFSSSAFFFFTVWNSLMCICTRIRPASPSLPAPLYSPSISIQLSPPSVTSGKQPVRCTADWKQALVHLAQSGTHLTEIFVKRQITWLRLLRRAAVAVWRIRNIPLASPPELKSFGEAMGETEWWNTATFHRHSCKIMLISHLQIRLFTLDPIKKNAKVFFFKSG